jgi:UDPglucose 6-dehydrogenase
VRVAVIGTGYVGLVSGAGFSDFGNDVICVDIDVERIERLRAGHIPIHEPGLDRLVESNLEAGRLTFSTDTASAVDGVDVVIIAVGTPTSQNSGAPDLRYLESAARDIGRGLTDFAVIANKSTVPVGTADRVRELVAEHARVDFAVASNPEFLKEGDAVNDFMKPSRVVLGTDDPRATRTLRALYEPFVRTNNRIQVMDIRSAELTKYAANAMLATRISFMNELSLLAEKVGADIEKVRRGIGSDPRIGAKFLFPGAGFGGSCFPKDLRALIHTARQTGTEVGVIEAVARANERQKLVLGARVREHFGGSLSGKRIAVWGLAFKPETDDIREAPALVLIDELIAAGAKVVASDPQAADNTRARLGDHIEIASMYEAAEGADALVLVTEWHQFRRPDFEKLRAIMREPALFDGRNIWPADVVRELGFSYYGIGRP